MQEPNSEKLNKYVVYRVLDAYIWITVVQLMVVKKKISLGIIFDTDYVVVTFLTIC